MPGWRDEMYPVTSAFTAQPLLLIERAAAVPFGIKVGCLSWQTDHHTCVPHKDDHDTAGCSRMASTSMATL